MYVISDKNFSSSLPAFTFHGKYCLYNLLQTSPTFSFFAFGQFTKHARIYFVVWCKFVSMKIQIPFSSPVYQFMLSVKVYFARLSLGSFAKSSRKCRKRKTTSFVSCCEKMKSLFQSQPGSKIRNLVFLNENARFRKLFYYFDILLRWQSIIKIPARL